MGIDKRHPVACLGALLVLLCSAALAQAPFQIAWANDRLTVRAADAPLADVMEEVARVTGIDVTGLDRLAGVVTADFADLPPTEALATLLAGVNYLLGERPADETGARRLLVQVHSMAGASLPAATFSGPIHAPALAALLAAEVIDEEDDWELELELEDDPDAVEEELREQKLEAARLVSDGAFGPDADLDSLADHLDNDFNDSIRFEAVKALAARPIASVLPLLVTAMGDIRLHVKTAAVEILGRATDRESLATVGRLLEKDQDKYVRVSALRVLALRADEDSVTHLRAVLEDEDPDIRAVAGQMLAELDRRALARRKGLEAGGAK